MAIKYLGNTKQVIKEVLRYIHEKEIRVRFWYGEKGRYIPYKDVYIMGYILIIKDRYYLARSINQERDLQLVLTDKIIRIDDTVGKVTIYKDKDFDEGDWNYFFYHKQLEFEVPEIIYHPEGKWIVTRNGEFYDMYETKKEAVYRVEFELGLRYDVFP